MSEQTPEQDPQLDDQLGDDTTPEAQPEPEPAGPMFALPEDAADDVATGYAVYDQQLGRFVGGVTKSKPSKAEARKLAQDHDHGIVRV